MQTSGRMKLHTVLFNRCLTREKSPEIQQSAQKRSQNDRFLPSEPHKGYGRGLSPSLPIENRFSMGKFTPAPAGAFWNSETFRCVNGLSNADLQIHTVTGAISELSQGMTLLPGTIIATGAPSGVSMGFYPPRFLRPGDEVVCEVERIGALRNTIGRYYHLFAAL